ncbi:MAG: imidazolonepropionase [Actinobacteria bacterium]|nr:imidazolonepropionase [Actinomycetota bacterium]OJU85080.1 MAG: imidazolonepropionase [Solirubrobacterales bacterium 70-9]
MRTSIDGASQVLRPPADGLPFLRHDRAASLRSDPGSLTIDGEEILAVESDAGAARRIDARGLAVVPGWVDCHTHLPFTGWRAAEYAMKVAGRDYAEIAAAGGGIQASAGALAEADDRGVLDQAEALAAEMLAHGTTTFETKSGYGLSIEAELRSLRLAAALGGQVPQSVSNTALIAHAVPGGFDADGWLDAVEASLGAMLECAPVGALDVFVESIAFTNRHLERVGALAAARALDLRAHVEQFASHRSVPVALAAGARSVDHLACLAPVDLPALADSECAAVLLPGAEVMGAEETAPARALADAGAIAVLATDANPGTSPIISMPLILGLAVRRYGWTAKEALLAATLNPAWVLRRSGEVGSLEVGKRADVLVLDGPIEQVPYRLGHNPVAFAFKSGELVFARPDCADRLSE